MLEPEGAELPLCPSCRLVAASGPLLLPAVSEGTAGGHIQRIPNPGGMALGNPPWHPHTQALCLRTHAIKPGQLSLFGVPGEQQRKPSHLLLTLLLLLPPKVVTPEPRMKGLLGGPGERALPIP